jgi:hypothetical protein
MFHIAWFEEPRPEVTTAADFDRGGRTLKYKYKYNLSPRATVSYGKKADILEFLPYLQKFKASNKI